MRRLKPLLLIGATTVLLAAFVTVLFLRAGDTVDTTGAAREIHDPDSDNGARRVGEPGPADGVIDDAPPALAYALDPDGPTVPGGELPDAPTFDGDIGSKNAVDTDLPWDEANAPLASTTTTPLDASAPAATIDVSTAADDPSAANTTTTSVPASSTSSTPTTTTITATTNSSTTTTAPPTTSTPATSTSTTTTEPPMPEQPGTKADANYIAPTAGTNIPVYDTAWQMLVRSTPAQADNYFAALKANGFSGAWAGVIHHAPATYNLDFAGGGAVGRLEDGNVVLTDEYIEHVTQILDAADEHGMKVGLVAAWQNLYLPGGGSDAGVASSDAVRGTITTDNAHAYGLQIAQEFGGHPAVSMWVFGGDAGTNNTEANKAVWREMARGVRDAGNGLSITYHTPTSEFDQLNYAGEDWLEFIAPETGHAQDASTTEAELKTVGDTYGLPVWQGEPRYFNINFDWVDEAFRNPGVDEVQADAQAAKNADVSGYVYGDAGRWTWCAGYGDSTPCDPSDVAASFGDGEAAVIEVFRD